MAEQSSRRWFSFSLRSLLVVMTLLCVWLAWESSVMRQRQRMLAQIHASHAFQVTTAKTWAASFPNGNPYAPVAHIPFYRRWLGDEAIQEIGFFGHMVGSSGVDIDRVAKLFPEAKLQETALMEPCHPGCFPHGTLVATPAGPRAIETISVASQVVAFRPSGERFVARVNSNFNTENRLWRVTTEAGELLTTETQPLCVAVSVQGMAYETRSVGELAAGDFIWRLYNDDLQAVKVLSVEQTPRVQKVINLVLGDCEAFVANGYLARSKPPADPAPEATAE